MHPLPVHSLGAIVRARVTSVGFVPNDDLATLRLGFWEPLARAQDIKVQIWYDLARVARAEAFFLL